MIPEGELEVHHPIQERTRQCLVRRKIHHQRSHPPDALSHLEDACQHALDHHCPALRPVALGEVPQARDPALFAPAYAAAEANPAWQALVAPESALFPWDPASTYIRRPPFAQRTQPSRLGLYAARDYLAAHPPIGLWPVTLRKEMRAALHAGTAGPRRWADGPRCARVDWPTAPVDPFLNVNTPEDLAAAEALLPSA